MGVSYRVRYFHESRVSKFNQSGEKEHPDWLKFKTFPENTVL